MYFTGSPPGAAAPNGSVRAAGLRTLLRLEKQARWYHAYSVLRIGRFLLFKEERDDERKSCAEVRSYIGGNRPV